MKRQILLISICCVLTFIPVSAGKKEKVPNLATLPGVVATQSADCGPRNKKFYASGAIDGNKKTYSFTCKDKKSSESIWFKLKLANDETLIKQVIIVPMKKRTKNIIRSTLTILDNYGDVVFDQPINLNGKKRGMITVDLGEGIFGNQIIIARSQRRKDRFMRLAEVKVVGDVPVLPDYYQVPSVKGCPPGTDIARQEDCFEAGHAAGGDIKKYKRMRVGTWTGHPLGCFIGVGFYNNIGWNKSDKTDETAVFDNFASVCTRLHTKQ
jgi:hypothetical protein